MSKSNKQRRSPNRFKIEYVATKYGWTRWVQPRMSCYWLKCCDCGLVHEMKFRIHEDKVQFRVRRAKRKP